MILVILIGLSAILAIMAEYRRARWAVYIFKPLTTFLIVLIGALAIPSDRWYQALIVAGLLFSLIGDVFLMLPGNRFVAGLISFLFGHLCYIGAFVWGDGPRVSGWLLPGLIYFAVLMYFLWPHAGALKVPVLIYGVVITVMLWQAVERAAALPTFSSGSAAMGAALFVLSDSALAWNRFVRPFRAAQALVLGTYWAGQSLIALSVNS
ncbi:MAG: lysoplasmalogenase [Anaerolineae bacterium]|nr:lysoplasmalogenase [Thermoflexales bacterium]MDW8406605.1 lysoplasmalogenase [Anaerolineae bacterium]